MLEKIEERRSKHMPLKTDDFAPIAPPLRDALRARGFVSLTTVQTAVLAESPNGSDLRISSQTGSGKTVAIGMALYSLATTDLESSAPRILILAPTRELATQVRNELAWLYERTGIRLVTLTGGASYGGELRSLRRGVDLIVATPGRLRDHLERGSFDPRSIGAVVLDEADQMLDLGFRDDLDAILEKLPVNRTTHMMSATFPPAVQELARRFQRNPVVVEGTRLGEANVDIHHVAHLVVPAQRDDVLINLLLLAPEEPTLVFVRTRVDATDLGANLAKLGFSAGSLTGDMEQRERNRTLDAFRDGVLRILVATDVAARGIDVVSVSRVVHADPPSDADVYTHRSGRTGRGGRKGTSFLLVPSPMREFARRLLRTARVEAVWAPAPSEQDATKAVQERIIRELGAPAEEAGDQALEALADQLLATVPPALLVTRLLARSNLGGPCAPRAVAALEEREPPPRPRPASPRRQEQHAFTPFRIHFGARHGADPRRLLAMVCRRGGVASKDIGAIDVGPDESRFEVAAAVAHRFGQAVRVPDDRDPGIWIGPLFSPAPWSEAAAKGTSKKTARHEKPRFVKKGKAH
jgi:ATP-dependent RNA helicase DeaD